MTREQPRNAVDDRGVSRLLILVIVVVLAAFVVLIWLESRRAAPTSGAASIGSRIEAQAYQAVFLVGGQIYFGRLAVHDGDWLLLSDVYYLQSSEGGAEGQPSGQLIKRGSELHAPQEPMLVPMQQVLFVENLRDDGEVVRAIRAFGSAPRPQAPVVTASPTPRAGSPSPTR